MTAKTRSDIRRKLRILNHAKETGNVSKTCRYFGIGREKHYVDKEIVIEAIPRLHTRGDKMHGKAWISEGDYSITRIEWTSDSVENMDALEIEAEFLKARPEIKCFVEFKHRIKDIRFPNKYSLIEAYYHNKRKLYNRTEITVRYKDYQFFTVSTEVKG